MDRKRTTKKSNGKALRAETLTRRAAQAARKKEAASARMHNYLAENHPEMEIYSITI
jgi:hypothetical protein